MSTYLDKFEEAVSDKIDRFLLTRDAIDRILPDATDIMEHWEGICRAYLPDGVREFEQYPTVSLGWMMFIGMAMAAFWDEDWEKYSLLDDIYAALRDMRGYDELDDCILQDILGLPDEKADAQSSLVADTASIAHNALIHEGFEPGTPDAFNAYVRCLHRLYYFGAAVELYRRGYRMTPLN